jgi:hypothetical protein
MLIFCSLSSLCVTRILISKKLSITRCQLGLDLCLV